MIKIMDKAMGRKFNIVREMCMIKSRLKSKGINKHRWNVIKVTEMRKSVPYGGVPVMNDESNNRQVNFRTPWLCHKYS